MKDFIMEEISWECFQDKCSNISKFTLPLGKVQQIKSVSQAEIQSGRSASGVP